VPEVLTAADHPELFARWRDGDHRFRFNEKARYGAFARHYYPVAFAGTRQDASFAIAEGDRPRLLALATAGDCRLDYYGSPLRLCCAEPEDGAAIAAAFAHIDQLIASRSLKRVEIAEEAPSNRLSPVGEACLNRHFRPSLRMTAWGDLSEGETSLRRGLRKSYKSLLNWGRANMTIAVVNRETPDRAQFDRYQAFHQAVAGRSFRVQNTWDALFTWIESGQGELVLGFLQDDLVAGTLVGDAEGSAYYVSGVYDRERFDKPMAHWPLWTAMLRAHERGLMRFELGDIPLDGDATPKEVAIGFFKRGFATEIATSVVWSLDAHE